MTRAGKVFRDGETRRRARLRGGGGGDGDHGDPAMVSTWVGDDGGWASSDEDGWTEAAEAAGSAAESERKLGGFGSGPRGGGGGGGTDARGEGEVREDARWRGRGSSPGSIVPRADEVGGARAIGCT